MTIDQVQQREQEDPDNIDKVPVHRGSFNRLMMLRGELAPHGADQDDGHEHTPTEDVGPVEAGQRVEGGAKHRVARPERQLRIVVHLEREERQTKCEADEERPDQSRAIALAELDHAPLHRE